MLGNLLLLCSSRPHTQRKKKKDKKDSLETETKDLQFWSSVTFNKDHHPPIFTLRSERVSKKGEMSNRVSNFSDLIQRVTASCLLHPLASTRHQSGDFSSEHEEEEYESEEEDGVSVWDDKGNKKVLEMHSVMQQVFDAVSAMKIAYVGLQEAHSPWDPDRMRGADVAVVGELKRIGILRERFRRITISANNKTWSCGVGGSLREVVAPYEAAVEELKREVKSKEVEIDNLNQKLRTLSTLTNNGGKKGKPISKRKVICSQVATAPAPELFEATMMQIKEASKSFTSLLLSLMRSARWDITAAVRSIEAATAASVASTIPCVVAAQDAKFALESYVSRKIFQGFDHETFYMDGSLSSLLNPQQYRHDCFTQFCDMKAMDPVELLGILPTCHFGKFCSKKYLSIVHPKMEESLFGNLEQHRQVLAGSHPRTQFYSDFLGMAKTVWLLHLLAFSLDPAPTQFEASRGAEFHQQYMDSVVKFTGGRVPTGHIVGFPVSPGFKLGNGSVIKARVYLVPKM